MDRDLALIIVGSCVKAAKDIGDLAHVVPKDRKDLKLGVAAAVHEIYSGLIDIVLAEFPELKDDMERRLVRYGRLI